MMGSGHSWASVEMIEMKLIDGVTVCDERWKETGHPWALVARIGMNNDIAIIIAANQEWMRS